MDDPVSESAKAVQETAKAAGKVIDASREAGSFIARLLKGPLEQGVGIWEDRLRYMRMERQLRLQQRYNAVLAELGLSAPTRPIPLKFAVPLLQAATMEDDDSLQDRWVNLLINATTVDSGIEIQRTYIAILEQITPLEAQILDAVYALPFFETSNRGVLTSTLPEFPQLLPLNNNKAIEFQEPNDAIRLAISNLARLGCIVKAHMLIGSEAFSYIYTSVLGREFVKACSNPVQQGATP